MRRAWAGALIALVCMVACGGRDDVFEVPPDSPTGATRSLALPDPVPAVAAFRVDLDRPLEDPDLQRLAGTPGVAAVGEVALDKMKVRGPQGSVRMTIGASPPLDFRPVAPAATRDAAFVWTSLMADRAVVTFDAARRLGLSEAGSISIGATEIDVGAFADNGIPNIADILVSEQVGALLGIDGPSKLVIGVGSDATLQRIGGRLRQQVGSAGRIERLLPESPAPTEPAAEPQPVGSAHGGVIGEMSFRILKNGFIEPDPAWVSANIAIGEVPILGSVTCHRFVFGQLGAALAEIEDEGLASEIRAQDYGGCFVPRFIDRDPGKPLSMHAFGLAIDFNTSTNRLGTSGDMHPRVVEIFQRWGFTWGGNWARPDPMHFELARLIQT